MHSITMGRSAQCIRHCTYRQEDIRHIHSDKNGIANPGQIDDVTGADEVNRNKMVNYKLCKAFPGLLKTEHQDEELLSPV
jgi:hypothetical protein